MTSGPTSSPRVRESTGAIVRSKDGIVFIVSPPRHWHADQADGLLAPFGCVGGKLEAGERPIDAVRREIGEETIGARWLVTGRNRPGHAFLPDGTEVAWDWRHDGSPEGPDIVIIEDGVASARRLLYGFGAAVTGDPQPHGGHPAILHIPWSLMQACNGGTEPPRFGVTDIVSHGGRVVPGTAMPLLAGARLFPIGTARLLNQLSAQEFVHPIIRELGIVP